MHTGEQPATTASTAPVRADDRVSPKQYAFLAFLTLISVMNFVDRQLLASFANFIVPDLGLTDTQFGLLTGFAFILFYAFMGLFAGALADTLHRPRLMAAGLALWSVLTAVSGAARGFATLAIPRMFIGVGESVCTPTAMSMLADRFPARRLGLAAGVYYMGVPIGVGCSLIVAGFLGPAIGWRNCFYLLGALGVALSVVLLFVKETPRRHHTLEQLAVVAAREDETVPLETPRQSFREIVATLWLALRSSPALGLTIAGGVSLHFILGAATFDQLWYVQERGFERAWIAQVTGIIAVFAGVTGNLIGGLGGDWFQNRFNVGRPMFLVWVMLLMAPLNVVYRLAPPDSWWFWLGLTAGYLQLGAFYGPTFSTVQELVPPGIRATCVAFYILLLNLVGLGIGITAGGVTIDWLRAQGAAEPYTWTLLAFTLISTVAIPLFWLAGRRFTADKERLYRLTTATEP
jgi:MFS family permease